MSFSWNILSLKKKKGEDVHLNREEAYFKELNMFVFFKSHFVNQVEIFRNIFNTIIKIV